MKFRMMIILVFAILLFAGLVDADESLMLLEDIVAKQQAKVDKWERQANTALFMVITVGIIGAVIAFIQRVKIRRRELITAILGLVASVVTVLDANIYPDHKTFKKRVLEAKRIMQDVDWEMMRAVKPEDEDEWRSSIQSKIRQIYTIEMDLVAAAEPFRPTLPGAAFAQLPRAAIAKDQPLPDWISELPDDKYYLYFLGQATDASFSAAKLTATDNARQAATAFLVETLMQMQTQPMDVDVDRLSEYLTQSAEVHRDHYSLGSDGKEYEYYVLLRLAKGFVENDLQFFAIEKRMNSKQMQQMNEQIQQAQTPQVSYFDERKEVYANLIDRARTTLPPDQYKQFLQARQWRKDGDSYRALPVLEGIVEQYPDFYMGWYNVGLARDAVNDTAGALQAYERAVELEPLQPSRDASLYNTYGYLLLRQQRLEDAERMLQTALDINPEHPTAVRNLKAVRALME